MKNLNQMNGMKMMKKIQKIVSALAKSYGKQNLKTSLVPAVFVFVLVRLERVGVRVCTRARVLRVPERLPADRVG